MKFTVKNLNETEQLAKNFAASLNGGEVVLLNGDLGAGKTTFTKYVFNSLGVKDVVNFGLYYKFTRTKVKSASFPSLTTISGSNACGYMLQYCTALISVSFPALTTISNACYYMLQSCTALTDVYFPALTTTSFGSYTNQFYNMMSKTGTNVTHTLHFPSNLESKIQRLQGYPTFGGTSGYVVCAFDLPATK